MGINIPKKQSVPLMPNMDDCLFIGFDKHKGERTWLAVMRREGETTNVVNMFKDEEAEELYKKLVDWDR